MWALLVMPNATTGVSPYRLVYGRLPHGPLAVLKESWIDQRNVSADLGKPVESYMTEFRARLKKAADWAELHARHGQEVYTHNHNLRSKDKRFDEGDKGIILDDDAAVKLCKRRQGPATVVRMKSPLTWGDSRVRHVHANKMRKFHVRVQSCKIISENDVDFGRVLVPAIDESDALPSVNVSRSKIEHLDPGNTVNCSRYWMSLLSVSAINQVYAGLVSTKFGSQVNFNQNG